MTAVASRLDYDNVELQTGELRVIASLSIASCTILAFPEPTFKIVMIQTCDLLPLFCTIFCTRLAFAVPASF